MPSIAISLDDVDAAIFDLDGVVTDTARVHAASWAALFDGVLTTIAPHAAPFDPDLDYRHYVDGKPRLDGVRSFLAARGIDVPDGEPDDPAGALTVHGMARRKDQLFGERLSDSGVRSFGSTVAFVQGLRDAGRRVGVVSASRHCHEILEQAGLGALFDVVVDGTLAAERALAGKPDPATFLFAAQRLGAPPARTLLVEDALAGVEAAQRGGFRPIVAIDRRGGGSEDLRRAGADVVVADLADVSVEGLARTGAEPANAWRLEFDLARGDTRQRATDALCALSDGTVGVRGDLLTGSPPGAWVTLVAGAFGTGGDGANGAMVRLLPGPSLTTIVEPAYPSDDGAVQRSLDLRAGLVTCRVDGRRGSVSVTRFVSLARPGLVALRAERGAYQQWSRRLLEQPKHDGAGLLGAAFAYRGGQLDDEVEWAETSSDRARVCAVATQRLDAGTPPGSVERLALFRARRDDDGGCDDLVKALAAASSVGFDGLLDEHRRAWAQRWDAADIIVDGDERSQQAIRLALFHLLSCAPVVGDAGVGARGLSGLAYSGHVFWDADVFVLPALAAMSPESARSMVEYRAVRLGRARAGAKAVGCAGARFPWESADSGDDVTPRSARDHEGNVVEILTGTREEHINADVAWAALHYLEWTGDTSSVADHIGELVVETARYWASRIRVDEIGVGHVDSVIGPDEYHELVDDNAFTNIMVRWHLRRAATIVGAAQPDEASRWRCLASSLVDGYDAATGRHEQFAGFSTLEPLRIADIADVPVAADVLLGRARTAQAQVLKQPDVLMAHHLVPDQLPSGSLATDLDFYLPRTAHGSSLSPAVCASLLARAGRSDDAMALFDLAARMDLDDLTGTTGGGLHFGTFGGLWQAVVVGFGGVRPVDGVLHVWPSLPARWPRLRIRVRFQGMNVRLDLRHDRVSAEADGPARLVICGLPATGAAEVALTSNGWEKQ